MADPWDTPPFPDRGDASPDETRLAKQRALDEWNRIEHRLFELNVRLGRSLDHVEPYGAGPTFAARLTVLQRTAAAYFVKHPNQAIEGQFCVLCATVKKMAERRNDIDHGVLTPYTTIVDENGFPDLTTTGYVISPDQYDIKRLLDEKGTVAYIYSSKELMQMGMRFLVVSVTIHEFTERFVL